MYCNGRVTRFLVALLRRARPRINQSTADNVETRRHPLVPNFLSAPANLGGNRARILGGDKRMNGATGLGYRLTCGGEDTTAWLRLCFFCCCCLLAPGRSGQVSQIMQKQRNTFSLSPFAFRHTHVSMNCSPQEWQEMCQNHTKNAGNFYE